MQNEVLKCCMYFGSPLGVNRRGFHNIADYFKVIELLRARFKRVSLRISPSGVSHACSIGFRPQSDIRCLETRGC